jgi:uncharacterized small protein (TIGR04563 family)
MPYYLRMSRIDWHYDNASPELRAILPEANLNLSSPDHTKETFDEQLSKLAAERSDLMVDALIEDGFRGYWLYRARASKVSIMNVVERPQDAIDRDLPLPLDDMATVTLVRDADDIRSMLAEHPDGDDDDGDEVDLPLCYRDETSMRELIDRVSTSINDGDHRFVAEVGLERFLVEIRHGAALVRKLIVVTEPALFARLVSGQFVKVPARADETRAQAVYWPQNMLTAIESEAFRLNASLSNIVQRAWKASREKIASSERPSLAPLLRGFGGDQTKQTIVFPGDMFMEIRNQATRLDASASFVAQVAWVLSHDAIAALPSAKDL